VIERFREFETTQHMVGRDRTITIRERWLDMLTPAGKTEYRERIGVSVTGAISRVDATEVERWVWSGARLPEPHVFKLLRGEAGAAT
jgi:hypothetical protein